MSRLAEVFRSRDVSFEILLINDASPDEESWRTIQSLCRRHPWVRGFDLMFNVGQFRALLCGFEQARGRYVITMDDDLQHPPEEIPELMAAMEAHPEMDCIIGKYSQKSHSLVRNMGSRIQEGLFRILYDKPAGLKSTSFRLMTAEFARVLVSYGTIKPMLGALIFQSSRRIMNVEVRHDPRQEGKSGYGFFSLLEHMMDYVFQTSAVPLRLFSGIGFLISICSILFGFAYFYQWLTGAIKQPGFTTLAILLFFFGGAIMMGIGILGEYVSRIMLETVRSPRHVIRSEAGKSLENRGESE